MPVSETIDELLNQAPDVVIVEALDPDIPTVAWPLPGAVRGILLEKPGGPSLSALVPLLRRLKAANTVTEFGYQLHYNPTIDRAISILKEGALGQVTLARFHASTPVGCSMELWQSLQDDLGGLMFTEGCHMLELIVTMLGTPNSVSGCVRKLPAGESVPTTYYKADLFSSEGPSTVLQVGTGQHEDVAIAALHYPNTLGVLDLTGWEAEEWVASWTLEFYGTSGTLRVGLAPPVIQLRTADGTTRWEARQGGVLSAYEVQFDQLLRRCRGESSTTSVGIETGLDVVRILDAIYRSAANGGIRTELEGVVL